MSVIILFICGLLWGVFDLIRKLALEFLSLITVVYVVCIAQLIIFLLCLPFSGLYVNNINYIPLLFIISALNLVSLFYFLKAIKIGEISMCIPLLSYSPLFSLIFAKLILNESLAINQYFGIAIIFLGSFILYSKSFLLKDLLFSPFVLIKNKGAQLIILVTIIWSIIPVLDKNSLFYTDLYLHGFLQSFLVLIFLILFFKIPRKKNIIMSNNKKHLFIILSLILISFLATYTQFIALNLSLVPILEVFKRALGVILSIFFGYIFFKEKFTKQKVFSVVILLLGLTLII